MTVLLLTACFTTEVVSVWNSGMFAPKFRASLDNFPRVRIFFVDGGEQMRLECAQISKSNE